MGGSLDAPLRLTVTLRIKNDTSEAFYSMIQVVGLSSLHLVFLVLVATLEAHPSVHKALGLGYRVESVSRSVAALQPSVMGYLLGILWADAWT